METADHIKSYPKIGEGVFLVNDVARILRLPLSRVRHWLVDYWESKFAKGQSYVYGELGSRAVNFYTLIEFYTFYQLREHGVSAQKIQKAHEIISRDLNTKYPFAKRISTDGSKVLYEHLEGLIIADGKRQFSIKENLDAFLHKIEFGEDELAQRFFPLENSKIVVVDPKHQFGQPIIAGTNIKAEIIGAFYEGGESKENISNMYDISIRQVEDAILYYKQSA